MKIRRTPMVPAPAAVAKGLGVRAVLYKLDLLQPSGSFKYRGMSHLIASLPESTHVVSSSGGNAGLACALAAHARGLRCTVFVPTTTPRLTVTRLEALGATVVVGGSVWDEANDAAVRFVADARSAGGEAKLVHPFDDPVLWDGHSTLSLEIAEQVKELYGDEAKADAVICSVGGGGLMAGILTGFMRSTVVPSHDRPVIVGVETHGAASFAAAVENGNTVVRIKEISSICKSLGALAVAQGLLDLRAEYGTHLTASALVSDKDAVAAMVRLADDERLLVEPSCGASLAMVYATDGRLKKAVPRLDKDSIVVVVVCGGAAVTLDMISAWRQQFDL